MSKPQLPHAAYRINSKRGDNDCAVAAMATIFRRDPEEVLIAAAKFKPTVWRAGLFCTDMVKVARRLGIKATWAPVDTYDPEESTGVLWVSYRDSTKEHCVVLIDGKVFETEHHPVSVWDYDTYCEVHNAYGNSLLQVIE